MSNLSNLNFNPVQLSIEQGTRLLVIKQGDNEVKLTREDINGLKKLREGGFNEIGPKGEKLLGGYITKLVPKVVVLWMKMALSLSHVRMSGKAMLL